ncbi:MAG: hypothetical protein HZA01_00670 [Nitrospinae bacterium]|nr:hypothetical protein [Nitrospinota bacterium]
MNNINKRQYDTPPAGLSDIKPCPNCWFPNKATYTKCSYCDTPLYSPASNTPLKWLVRVLNQLKWNMARLYRNQK